MRGREAADASPIYKIWGQQPVHTSLPFSPFGVQRKPYTSERRRRELYGWDEWMDGLMDGRMDGWTGDQKCPSIFLKFKYDNKKDVLIPNMVLKSVRGFFIKTYEHFKFKIWDFKDLVPIRKNADSRCAPAYLFHPSGSSESPTPPSAEGASCADD